MSTICFITSCMGRIKYLKKTLPRVVAQFDSSCVVVDYSCPEHCGSWASKNFPDIKVKYVEGQTHYNLSRSRNAGASVADAKWLCFFDADILFDKSFAHQVIPMLKRGEFYRAPPGEGTNGTVICSREDFEIVKGYDENYQGWGGEDRDFYEKLEFINLVPRELPATLIKHIPHDTELRVKYYQDKTLERSMSRNALYRLMKFDLMRITNGFLSEATCEKLYAEIASNIDRILMSGPPYTITFTIDMRELGPPLIPDAFQLTRNLSYTFLRRDDLISHY